MNIYLSGFCGHGSCCKSTLFVLIIITVFSVSGFFGAATAAAPEVSFTGTPESGTLPLSVTFTDQSAGAPTGWAWFFGDETYTQPWTEVNASSGWSKREGHTSVLMSDGSIVLMGGHDSSGYKNDVWRSTDKGVTWTLINLSAGWSARYAHTSVAMPDGGIVLMGGKDGSPYKNDVWRSEDKGATWTEMTAGAGWTARYFHTSVALSDGSIVLMGGHDGAYKNDVWRSTDNGATWTRINAGAGWAAREAHSSVVMPDGSIMLMGGYASGYVNDVWRSVDNGTSWTQVNSSAGWSARYRPASVVMPDSSIVLAGGGIVDGPYKNDVWRSEDNGTIWMQVNSSAGWSERNLHSCLAMPDGSIVLMGGGVNNGPYKNDTWQFSPAGSKLQNPSHIYASVGIYSVAMQAFNSEGYSSLKKTGYISVTPKAAVTGTITDAGLRESDIVSGGKTIIVTLTGASWTAADDGGTNRYSDSHALCLINNLTADSEASEWGRVKAVLINASTGGYNNAIIRDSETQVTITLPAVSGYNITSVQTVNVTVPASLTGAAAIAALPAFAISMDATASVTGTVTDGDLFESDIVSGGRTIIVTLSGANWTSADDLGSGRYSDSHALCLINNLTADSEASEWAGVKAVLINASTGGYNNAIIRDSTTQVTITLPAAPGYDITSKQTVTVTAPANLTDTVAVAAEPAFTINVTPAPSPTAAPTAAPSSGGESGGSSVSAGVSGSVKGGGTAGFRVEKSAVYEVTATVRDDTPKMMVTVEKKALPRGIEKPDLEVYQYQQVNLYWTDDTDISRGTLEFLVSKDWLSKKKLTFADIVMIRYNEQTQTWEELPTEYIGEDENNYKYRATTPGFSYFGIAVSEGATMVSDEKSIKTVDVVVVKETAVSEIPEETTKMHVLPEETTQAAPYGTAPLSAILISGILLYFKRK